jgi:hypothetical protein
VWRRQESGWPWSGPRFPPTPGRGVHGRVLRFSKLASPAARVTWPKNIKNYSSNLTPTRSVVASSNVQFEIEKPMAKQPRFFRRCEAQPKQSRFFRRCEAQPKQSRKLSYRTLGCVNRRSTLLFRRGAGAESAFLPVTASPLLIFR